MHLLWLSHFIPYPPRGGAHQRSYNLLRHAAGLYETTFVAFNLQGNSPRELAEWQGELEKYCFRVIFWETPVKWKSLRWGANLALSVLRPEPYSCWCFWSPGIENKWEALLHAHPSALVHFDSIDLALFAGAAAGFRKVLNHHNCESAMARRRAEAEPNPAKKRYLDSEASKLLGLETRMCPRFDMNLAVSQADVQVLRSRSPKAQFHVVENGTDTGYFTPPPAPPEPDTLVFTGSLNWYPNISAIQFFVREVWPQVKRERPGVQLYTVGMKPSKSLVAFLGRDPQITLVDSPPDVRPWMANASVFICPMTDGGGTKVKILDAMAMGKAVVSTSVGAEGLEVKHGENILIADTSQDFAARVTEALRTRALQERLGREARLLVERKYSWPVVGVHLEEAYRLAGAGGQDSGTGSGAGDQGSGAGKQWSVVSG
jgi:glycosyltransferase involved in cell wall biosynthesis